MSDFNSMLEDIAEKTAVLKENKVAKTAYTDTAYANDDAEGVSSYAYAQEQNIPDIASIDTNDKILTKGFRSQSASIPRMYLNHMFGRISYNLNKAVDFLNTIAQAVVALNRLGGKYSPSTQYRQFDTCSYPIAVGATTRLMRFIRVSDSPEILTGVPPVNVGGDINVNWADAYSYKANLAGPSFTDAEQSNTIPLDNASKLVANTEFVQGVAEALADIISSKANIDSPAFTGEPTAPTPVTGDNSAKLATTEFIQAIISSSGGFGPFNLTAGDVSVLWQQKNVEFQMTGGDTSAPNMHEVSALLLRVSFSGSIRLRWEMRQYGAGLIRAYVLKNKTQVYYVEKDSSVYQTYTYDITDLQVGDVIRLHLNNTHTGTGTHAYFRNIQLLCAEEEISTVSLLTYATTRIEAGLPVAALSKFDAI